MKKIIGLFSLLSLGFLLTSCSNGGSTRTSGYFTYKIDTKTNELMLIGLSEEGKQQKTIVIPSIIDGKPVARIGHEVSHFLADGKNWETEFESEVLETIYFPSGLCKTELNKSFYSSLPNVKTIYWGDIEYNGSLYSVAIDKVYVSLANLSENEKQYSIGKYYKNFNAANVCYYMNDGTENTYFVDYANGTKVNVIPSIPYREGFSFDGWYKDQELITLWDFENDIANTIEVDDEGKEVINETKIYAKWRNA